MSKKNSISLECLANGPLPPALHGGYKGATVRFEGMLACCTTAYNHSMTEEEKGMLARRIAAALNATRDLSVEQIELLRVR